MDFNKTMRGAAGVFLLAVAAGAGAQEHSGWYATFENDSHFDTDRYYTNGIQLTRRHDGDSRGRVALAWSAPLCRWLGCDGHRLVVSSASLGQLMYTPRDITIAAPQPDDRPWAGLLYYEQSYAFLAPDRRTLTTLSAEAGVTGRLSLSEPAQKLVHRIIDRPPPQGWDNQVGNSLAMMVTAERRSARDSLSFDLWGDVRLNTASYWRLSLGNIITHAAGGLAVVVGKGLPPVSPAPPGIGTKLARDRAGLNTVCWWHWLQCTMFASVELRAVAYNVFLDGRAWRDDPHVKRRPWVGEAVTGLRVDFPHTRSRLHGPWFAQFQVTRRTREFDAAVRPLRHTFGALTIGREF